MLSNRIEETRHIRGWTNLGDLHPQEFIPRVAVLPDGSRVDLEKLECLLVGDVHRQRIGGENDFEWSVCGRSVFAEAQLRLASAEVRTCRLHALGRATRHSASGEASRFG